MRHGAITLQDRPAEEIKGWWRELDAAGVGTLWLADHLVNPMRPHVVFHEAWTLLGALAGVTRRARIGPLVSPMTFRLAPVLARAADTLDELSGGRAELGVGAGGAPADHQLTGVERGDAKERARRLAGWVPSRAETRPRCAGRCCCTPPGTRSRSRRRTPDDLAGRAAAVGIDELVVYWPPGRWYEDVDPAAVGAWLGSRA